MCERETPLNAATMPTPAPRDLALNAFITAFVASLSPINGLSAIEAVAGSWSGSHRSTALRLSGQRALKRRSSASAAISDAVTRTVYQVGTLLT